METTTPTKKEVNWDRILSFAILALLFLLSFSLGGSDYTYLLEAAGFLVAVLCVLFLEKPVAASEKKALFFYAIPLLVFALFTSFGRFWLSGGTLFLSSAFVNLMGFVGYFLLGYLYRRLQSFNWLYLFVAVLGGLALLVLINAIITLVDYGPFYLARYAAYERFEDGIAYPISNEYGFLNGFHVTLVTPSYGLSYAFLLASSLSALFFISPKEKKELFITIAVLGEIGLLSLVLAFSKRILFVYAFLMVLAVILRFVRFPKQTPKWEKITFWVILGVVGIFLLIAFINGLAGIAALNQGFLGKIFNNSRLAIMSQILQVSFKPNGRFNFLGLFGMDPAQSGYWNNSRISAGFYGSNTVVELTALYEGGVFAFFGLLTAMAFAVISARRFLHEGESIDGGRVLIVFFLLAYVLYATLFSSSVPFVYDQTRYVSPIFENGLLTVVLFFLGLSYHPIFALKDAQRRTKLYEEE
jgi:hypothetical protein